jgi:uncharacterized protein
MSYVPPRRSAGTLQGPRQVQAWPAAEPFRILTVDGGGICGILPAAVLAELEVRYLGGGSVAQHFDMIAGTSTGGIIALALAHGKTAAEIRDIYLERGGVIFPPASPAGRVFRFLRRGVRTVYDGAVLESELLRIFGDATLGEARTRLVIPAFEGRHGEPWIFKTRHHPDYKKDRVERMVRVGLATAAAPTFFQALPNNGYLMLDGGLWSNNPVMNALVDALACFDIRPRQVHVLSLGCGETSFAVGDARARGGLLHWSNIFFAALRAQSLNAVGQAYLLIGKDQVVRLDVPQSPSPIRLDDFERARRELPDMSRSLVEAGGSQIAAMFLSSVTQPYVPCPVPAREV